MWIVLSGNYAESVHSRYMFFIGIFQQGFNRMTAFFMLFGAALLSIDVIRTNLTNLLLAHVVLMAP